MAIQNSLHLHFKSPTKTVLLGNQKQKEEIFLHFDRFHFSIFLHTFISLLYFSRFDFFFLFSFHFFFTSINMQKHLNHTHLFHFIFRYSFFLFHSSLHLSSLTSRCAPLLDWPLMLFLLLYRHQTQPFIAIYFICVFYSANKHKKSKPEQFDLCYDRMAIVWQRTIRARKREKQNTWLRLTADGSCDLRDSNRKNNIHNDPDQWLLYANMENENWFFFSQLLFPRTINRVDQNVIECIYEGETKT